MSLTGCRQSVLRRIFLASLIVLAAAVATPVRFVHSGEGPATGEDHGAILGKVVNDAGAR